MHFDGHTKTLTTTGSQVDYLTGFPLTRDGDSLSGGGSGTFINSSCTANANWSFRGFVFADDAIRLRLAADLTGVVSGSCADFAIPCSFEVETEFLRN